MHFMCFDCQSATAIVKIVRTLPKATKYLCCWCDRRAYGNFVENESAKCDQRSEGTRRVHRSVLGVEAGGDRSVNDIMQEFKERTGVDAEYFLRLVLALLSGEDDHDNLTSMSSQRSITRFVDGKAMQITGEMRIYDEVLTIVKYERPIQVR